MHVCVIYLIMINLSLVVLVSLIKLSVTIDMLKLTKDRCST